MAILAIASTAGIAVNRLKGLFSKFGGLVKGKRPTATPFPEDFESHGFAGNYRITRDWYGLDLSEQDLRDMFERVHIPVARNWEETFGGRSNVKAGTNENFIVQNAGPFATHVFMAKLVIARRNIKSRPTNGQLLGESPPPWWFFPDVGGSRANGINEAGEKVSRESVFELHRRFKAAVQGDDLTTNETGQIVVKDSPPVVAGVPLGKGALATVGAFLVAGLLFRRGGV